MDRTVAAETLNFYMSFSERDALQDREHGADDGTREYPPSDSQDFSAHETYRISEARTALNNYVRRIRIEFDKLDAKIRQLKSKRDEEYASVKATLQKEKTRELALLNATNGFDSQAYQELVTRQDRCTQAYRIERNRAKREARIMLADQMTNISWLTWLSPYIGLLGLLAVLEIPINNLAIELAFEFVPPVSYIIAFLVGVTFVLMAHFAGIQILRMISVKGWMKLLHIALFLGLLFLSTFMVLILFEMRGQVSGILDGSGNLGLLEPAGPSVTGSPDLGALILGEQQAAPQPAPPVSNETAPATGFFERLISDPVKALFGLGEAGQITDEARFAQVGLLLLNALVLLIGTVLSVMRHDSNADLEFTYMREKRANDALNAFVRKYRAAEAAMQNGFGKQVSEVERQADELHQDILALQDEREQLRNQMENDMRFVMNALMEQLSAYQAGNTGARRTAVPVYFGRFGFAKLGDEVLIE